MDSKKPEITGEVANRLRQAEGYEPQFDIDLAFGEQAELFVRDIEASFHNGYLEIKHDGKWWRTGNLFAEVRCRHRDGVLRKSGLAASTATLWAFVLAGADVMLVIPRLTLREFVEDVWEKGRHMPLKNGRHAYQLQEEDGECPTIGIKIPLVEFLNWLRDREKKRQAPSS